MAGETVSGQASTGLTSGDSLPGNDLHRPVVMPGEAS